MDAVSFFISCFPLIIDFPGSPFYSVMRMVNLYQALSRKIPFFLIILLGAALWVEETSAKRSEILILEKSSSGLTLMINAGDQMGLTINEAILIRRRDKKLIAARVIKLFPDRSAVYIVAKYSEEILYKGEAYNMLYGIPLLGVPELPEGTLSAIDEVLVDDLEENPGSERLFTKEGREFEPEPDGTEYNPETALRPKFPKPNYKKNHSINIGVAGFQNTSIPLKIKSPQSNPSTLYSGTWLSYIHNFDIQLWIRKRILLPFSLEVGIGVYNFKVKDTSLPEGQQFTGIEVFPAFTRLYYNLEWNKKFFSYLYAGYEYNIVSAQGELSLERVNFLIANRPTFGIGSGLAISRTIDLRFDFGITGFMVGTGIKF